MDNVKESFNRVKKDIFFLKKEINSIRNYLNGTRDYMTDLCEILKKIKEEIAELKENQQNILNQTTSTHNNQNQTTSTHSSTHNNLFKPLNTQNLGFSTGNQGVPTDRQTDRQTDQQTQNTLKMQKNSVDNAVEILESLDSIKKEIRRKFKRLTDQEWLIFSTLYQLDEEKGYTDYKTLSIKLKLSESSIRDYIGRLIKKGISIEKKKINNKTIQLSVSQNLKKIATLSTIIQLRGI